MIFRDLTSTVGRTPMVELGRMTNGLPGRVAAKLEMRNPCGSVKDRLGVELIEDAERRGVLRRGMTLVEATGGNTGIRSAFAAAIRGYRLILTMPQTMSNARVALLLAKLEARSALVTNEPWDTIRPDQRVAAAVLKPRCAPEILCSLSSFQT